MIDALLSWWILEFTALHCPPAAGDHLLLSLLSSLPSPSPHHRRRLAKILLLRRLHSDLASPPASISERTLDSLELLEDLENGSPREGDPLPSMGAAYAAVAAECAVRHLREEGAGEGPFREAVERVFGRRVGDALREGAGLGSPELEKWRKALESAARDPSMRRLVLGVDTRRKAADAVGAYVDEGRREIGRPFLELSAERWIRERAGGDDGNAETRKTSVMERDAGSSAGCIYSNKSHKIPPAEVVQTKETLKASWVDPCSSMKNDFPESLATAGSILNEIIGKSVNPKRPEQTGNFIDNGSINFDKSTEITAAKGASTSNLGNTNNTQEGKFNLMDRNPTAHTYQWGEDSIELTPEESPEGSKKSRFPSRKRRHIAPLELRKSVDFSRRRAKKWWTVVEEDTLREAVTKYGVGNWKFILNCHRTIFDGRTEVDLKDKWRNMTR